MSNIINFKNPNTTVTVDDLRKLINARNHLLKSVVYATAEEDVNTAVLTERSAKLHAMSEALEEAFFHFYVDQGERLDKHAAVDIIDGLLFDEIGMALALSNLAKQISADHEYDISDEDLTDIAEEDPALKNAKLEAI